MHLDQNEGLIASYGIPCPRICIQEVHIVCHGVLTERPCSPFGTIMLFTILVIKINMLLAGTKIYKFKVEAVNWRQQHLLSIFYK